MSTACIIQARMGSSRFPGKVLADVAGTSMLGLMLDRLQPLDADHLVVATSTRSIDDPVVPEAQAHGARVVRGPEDDVLGRFAAVLDEYPADTVVRLTADCPLMDSEVVANGIERHTISGADYTSNTLIRTYPDGLDVEVIDAHALRAAAEEAVDPLEREHVTPFITRRPERFRLAAFRTDLGDYHDLRWTVDTPEDLAHVRSLINRVGTRSFSWSEGLSAVPPPSSPPPGEVRLRIPRGGDRIPADLPRNDPARRVWTVEDEDGVRGWVQVIVRMGIGEVRLDVDRPSASLIKHVLTNLQRTLGSQVVSLRAGIEADRPEFLEGFQRAGFDVAARTRTRIDATWERS